MESPKGADGKTSVLPAQSKQSDDSSKILKALAQAQAFQHRKNWKASIKLLRPFADKKSSDFTLLYTLGLAYENTGRSAEALDFYMKASLIRRSAAELHYRMAQMLTLLGRPKDAEKRYQEAVTSESSNTTYLAAYAHFLSKHGRNSDAIPIYLKIVASSPERSPQIADPLIACLEALNAPLDAESLLYIGFSQADLYVIVAAFDVFADLQRNANKHFQVLVLYRNTVALDPKNPRWPQMQSRAFMRLNLFDDAADAIGSAIVLSSQPDASLYAELASIRRRQRKWWQEADAMERAIEIDRSNADWWFNLGNARDALKQYDAAATAFIEAVDLSPVNANWQYRLGFALKNAGKGDDADVALRRAIELEPKARFLGIGYFHSQRALWGLAAAALQENLSQVSVSEVVASPDGPKAYFDLGIALERSYRWAEAAKAYENAIALGYEPAEVHYRLGFVWERRGEWANAAQAYKLGIESSPEPNPQWWYRLGFVLNKAGEFREAAAAWQRVPQTAIAPSGDATTALLKSATESRARQNSGEHPEHYSSALFERRYNLLEELVKERPYEGKFWYLLGNAYEAESRTEDAIAAYWRAVVRTSNHEPTWYHRLGALLAASGRDEEACKAFLETVILKRAYVVEVDTQRKNQDELLVAHYNEYRDTLPIRPDVILYEANLALSVGCNPAAIFERLLADPAYSGFTHVWSLKEVESLPARYFRIPNLFVVRHGSDQYLRYLASAKYLINNSTFPTYFIRRDEQRYLNTWHGTPLKALGKDMSATNDFMGRANTARNLLQTTHVISPNKHTSHVVIDRNDISSSFSGKLAETGYPRIDRMINASDELKSSLRKRLGLDPKLPVVLYAPTWRGKMSDVEIDSAQLVGDLTTMASQRCQILFRGHHYAEKALQSGKLPVKIVPADIDTYEILSIVDLLVTDYSSIYFDFLPMNKPIIHYNYDLDDYASSRGLLYFKMEDMPGIVCTDRESLVKLMSESLDKPFVPGAKFVAAREQFCAHEDGKATQRAIEFFFNDSEESVVTPPRDERKSLLFFLGHFIPNGITSSAINLMNALDPQKYRVSITIDPTAVKANVRNTEKFFQLPDSVAVLGRMGRMVVSPEERWVIDDFNAKNDLPAPEAWDILTTAFRREFRRLFGTGEWDGCIDFDGYNRFWTSVFAAGEFDRSNTAVFLHNDMMEEFRVRFTHLEGIFRLYPFFAHVISVSKDMCEVNRRSLGPAYGIRDEAFGACPNVIDGNLIAARATEKMDADLAAWVKGAKLFATLGRLSPEKDHAKLIGAFAKVHKEHPEVRLAILGDGPLRPMLEHLIAELKLKDAVLLAGLRENPFPLLKRADCFVMSSNHEGQPMTILEALALGKPVVATDIDGNRGILKDKYGLLVENSEAGLVFGMGEYLAGKVRSGDFDFAAYRAEALAKFDHAVFGTPV